MPASLCSKATAVPAKTEKDSRKSPPRPAPEATRLDPDIGRRTAWIKRGNDRPPAVRRLQIQRALDMKRILLGSTALAGAAAMTGAAQASDGVKLEVGGFFQTVYEGVFDKKSDGHFGNHRNTDRFEHNAEVWFKGETTLDNGPDRRRAYRARRRERGRPDRQVLRLLVRRFPVACRSVRKTARSAATAFCRRAPRRTSRPSRRTPGAPTIRSARTRLASMPSATRSRSCTRRRSSAVSSCSSRTRRATMPKIIPRPASTAPAHQPAPTVPRITASRPMRNTRMPATAGAWIGPVAERARQVQ